MELDFNPPASKTTAEQIAEQLRIAILNGRILAGEQLRQEQLAKAFQVSRIPIREALNHLQAEGLVEMIPNRGAVVTLLSLIEVEEIYAIRQALETLALERAIPNMTAADFGAAEAILDQIDREDQMPRWAELNWAFHEALYAPARMPHLLRLVEGLHNNVARYLQVSSLASHDYLKRSQKQHRQLLELCRRKNVTEAVVFLRRHLTGPVDYLQQNSNRF